MLCGGVVTLQRYPSTPFEEQLPANSAVDKEVLFVDERENELMFFLSFTSVSLSLSLSLSLLPFFPTNNQARSMSTSPWLNMACQLCK
jgi:hypothetical protein